MMPTWLLVAALVSCSGHPWLSFTPPDAGQGGTVAVAAGQGGGTLERWCRRVSSGRIEKPSQPSASQYDVAPLGSVPVVADVEAFTVSTESGKQRDVFPFIVMIVQYEDGQSESHNLPTLVTRLPEGTYRLVSKEVSGSRLRETAARVAGRRNPSRILLGVVVFHTGTEGRLYPVEVQPTAHQRLSATFGF